MQFLPIDRRPVRALTRRAARARRRGREGAAIVEAVIMIPTLGLLLVGTLFAGRLYADRLRASVAARACAYEYAVNGCQKAPQSCDGLVDHAQSKDGHERSSSLLSSTRGKSSGVLDVFEAIPVLGNVLSELFGTTAHAT